MSWYRKLRNWVDTRVGLTGTILRPGPQYSLNVFYWLGAIMVVAFLLQGLTGLLMLLYYTPTVAQAYPTTAFIINSVPLGRLLETTHLYSAYAMIILAFMHMMRGYFVSVQKKPREFMWIVGMLMGLVVLAFGLTGYLLPWTVVSKSATDVTIGMIGFLPAQIGPTIKFLIAGSGSDAAELARFFGLHIVVLPAVFTILLAIKLYMFEIHGAAEPPSGQVKKGRVFPWFPDLFIYFSIMGAAFVAILLGASALFPMSLPPQFSPGAASSYVSQPEWYFLWMYQILKFSAFEGDAAVVALSLVTIALAALVLLPLFDRKDERRPSRRPVYTTLGVIIVVELVVLAVWGYYTPGVVISNVDAVIIVFGTAGAIGLMSWIFFRTQRMVQLGRLVLKAPIAAFMGTPFRVPRLTVVFCLLLVVTSISFASAATLLSSPVWNSAAVAISSLIGVLSFYAMASLVKKLERNQIVERSLP